MAELIWDGKYKDGKKVAPVRIALPFQTIETINESTQDRQQSLDMFASGRDMGWKNRLIWGDKKYVLPSLLEEFSGKVKLIYIDPPFNTGADFSFTATVPENSGMDEDEAASFLKEPSVLEQKAYRDTWGRGLDSYLQWFYETALLLRELLSEEGSIYVHCDWHVNSYLRTVLDEVFGKDNFLNEIYWKRKTGSSSEIGKGTSRFGNDVDSLLFYSKTEMLTFNTQYVENDPEYIRKFFRHRDPDGRLYRIDNLANPAYRPNLIYEYKGYKPPKNGWAISKTLMEQWDKEGRLYFPKDKDGRIQRKRYLDELKGQPLANLWNDILPVSSQSDERINYPTQKPETLLERILNSSSNEQDLILDCFCGSGTTASVAERLNRRWITCDLGRYAIHSARKRLLSVSGLKPFVIQNLGKYERQAWQAAEFPEPKKQAEKEQNYRRFILDLYKAEPVTGFSWLHGVKKDRMVHVGAVDAPVTLADVKAIAAETWKSVGMGKGAPPKAIVDILGWDFALEVNEVAKQIAAESGVEVHFKVIPREVLDKKAVEQGDVKFFELASLAVDLKTEGLEATVKLKDFVIVPDYVPEDVQKAIKHWSQWIDYWAVDWDYKNDTFHNQWQSYRSRQNPDLELTTTHTYEAPGEYSVVVKVIDILGNDTTKLMKVHAGPQSNRSKRPV